MPLLYYIQVHGARLKGSQEDVVIKVLKPGIEDILVADLNFVYVVARILEFLNPEISRTSLVKEIWTHLLLHEYSCYKYNMKIVLLLWHFFTASEIFNYVTFISCNMCFV